MLLSAHFVTIQKVITFLAKIQHVCRRRAYQAHLVWTERQYLSPSLLVVTHSVLCVGPTWHCVLSVLPPSSCSIPPTARVTPTTHLDSVVSSSAELVDSLSALPSIVAIVEPTTLCVYRVHRTDTDEREEGRAAMRTRRRDGEQTRV